MSLSPLALLPLAARLVAGPLGGGTPARVLSDTGVFAADSMSAARVTLTFGGSERAVAPVRSFEYSLISPTGPHRRGSTSVVTQLRFVREPDALSADLARRVSSGERYGQVDVVIEREGEVGAIVLHLHDVQVGSTHLTTNGDDVALTQQRLALEESIAQLTAQQAEARRQLGATEALARERLSPPLELARARSDVDVVEKRLAAQAHRLALVKRQITAWVPVQEEVALVAARSEVEVR